MDPGDGIITTRVLPSSSMSAALLCAAGYTPTAVHFFYDPFFCNPPPRQAQPLFIINWQEIHAAGERVSAMLVAL